MSDHTDLADFADRFDWYIPACKGWASELAETIEGHARLLAFIRSELAAGVPLEQVIAPDAATRLLPAAR